MTSLFSCFLKMNKNKMKKNQILRSEKTVRRTLSFPFFFFYQFLAQAIFLITAAMCLDDAFARFNHLGINAS